MFPAADLYLSRGCGLLLFTEEWQRRQRGEDLFSQRQTTRSIDMTLADATSHLKLRLPPYLTQHWESELRTDLETKVSQDHPADDC